MVETEVKFNLAEKEVRKLRKKLEKLGAWPQKQFEITTLFDNKDYGFLREGQTLRVRTIHLINPRGADLLSNNSAFLEFKDSLPVSEYNEREEISNQIIDFRESSQLIALLYRLGYRAVLIYEKERESWLGLEFLFGVTIAIDRLSDLGYFLEIEGEKEKIKKMIKILKLEKKKNIAKTTYQLYEEFLKKNNKSFQGIYISKLEKRNFR